MYMFHTRGGKEIDFIEIPCLDPYEVLGSYRFLTLKKIVCLCLEIQNQNFNNIKWETTFEDEQNRSSRSLDMAERVLFSGFCLKYSSE